ncbi:hypothetical protein LTS18_002769, partial [Coniosporium uncinatum]
ITVQLGFSERDCATDEVDQRIFEELTGRVYYDVGGFYERYFEERSWTNNEGYLRKVKSPVYAGVGGQNPQFKVNFF